MKFCSFIFFLLFSNLAPAQFPGPAGTPGTTAMHADSTVFVAWGAQCSVTRGWQDISNLSLGYTTVGDSSMATGKAGSNGVVSLGDGGFAIVTFSAPVTNGPGFDFAVFENAFSDTFLELAFVEVSSDGSNFFRFPATSNSPTSPQYDNNANMDATLLNNLAGKYRASYGTPFDLQELSGIPQLDISNITHIKIIDVVGSIHPSYSRYDKDSNVINDPWPTPFPSSGFDLDAVGVINQSAVGIKEDLKNNSVLIYPNPTADKFSVFCSGTGEYEIFLTNIAGKILLQQKTDSFSPELDISDFDCGIYFVHVKSEKSQTIFKLIKE